MPIRGHSNVQGFGSMGVTVKLRAEMGKSPGNPAGRSAQSVPGYEPARLDRAAEAGAVD